MFCGRTDGGVEQRAPGRLLRLSLGPGSRLQLSARLSAGAPRGRGGL